MASSHYESEKYVARSLLFFQPAIGTAVAPFAGPVELPRYWSVGIESDSEYFDMACQGIPRLRNYQREQADMFQTL